MLMICLVFIRRFVFLIRSSSLVVSFPAGLESTRRLQSLSLDHNQLISTKGLRDTSTLLHLDCSHNHLVGVEGVENCALLQTLDLRSNSLTEVTTAEQWSWCHCSVQCCNCIRPVWKVIQLFEGGEGLKRSYWIKLTWVCFPHVGM